MLILEYKTLVSVRGNYCLQLKNGRSLVVSKCRSLELCRPKFTNTTKALVVRSFLVGGGASVLSQVFISLSDNYCNSRVEM